MIAEISLLVMLVRLVDHIPTPPPSKQGTRGRGRPSFYSDRLFLKALVVMIVKHLHTPYELLCVLEQPTVEMGELRALLREGGRYPTRRTWERRLAALPDKLPAQIAPRLVLWAVTWWLLSNPGLNVGEPWLPTARC